MFIGGESEQEFLNDKYEAEAVKQCQNIDRSAGRKTFGCFVVPMVGFFAYL